MGLEVFFDLVSQPARAIVLFLKMNKIPFTPRQVAMRKGEHYSEEYRKVNPFQRIPVIIHNDFKLTESVAILRYLSREYNVPDHWYPKDSQAQARVDEYLEWQHLDTRRNCALYFLTKFIEPLVTQTPPNPNFLAKCQKEMEKTLAHIENTWLDGRPYLTGDKISIADLLGVCELEQPRIAGYDVKEGRPKIAAYMERVRNDTQPHYDEVHKVLNYMVGKFGGNPPTDLSKL